MDIHKMWAVGQAEKDSIWNASGIPTRIAAMLRAMAADENTTKKSVTIAKLSLKRLERLAKRQTHGSTAAAVMTTFIEAGLREAIERGYIRLEDDE